MNNAVYYTVGYSPTYIGVTKLSIRTLRASGWSGDIIVLCDQCLIDKCMCELGPNIRYVPMPDSKSPQEASIHKLHIFDTPITREYNALLFIDADIVVHTDVNQLLNKVIKSDTLYVGTENTEQSAHQNIYWSLRNYTRRQLDWFESQSIFVFNAGCFAFVCNDAMKGHFDNIRLLIANHVGEFFYEQSFMNVYFNLLNKTDRSLLERDKYVFCNDSNTNHSGKLVHFIGNPGSGSNKILMMTSYINTYFAS